MLRFFLIQLLMFAATITNLLAEPLRITIMPEFSDNANLKQLGCLREAIYFEGRNQSVTGMAAIGHVILNRTASSRFPDSICGVVHQGPMDGSPIKRNRCQFSYFCDGKSDNYPVNNSSPEVEAARWVELVAEIIMFGDSEDITNGGTYYHAKYVTPYWSNIFEPVALVGEHIFYVHN